MTTAHSPRLSHGALAALTLLACGGASAFQIDTGLDGYQLRLDTTVKYSAAARLKDRSPGLSRTVFGPGGVVGPNNSNQDDGDNNFGKGLVSNRLDLFSEMDLTGPVFGARVSAAAWYDQVYNQDTDNTTTTANHTPRSQFPDETRKLMGRKIELLDAFVSGKFQFGETPVTARLGRHTLLWGESLFFGINGIAGGMAPLDLVKLQSVPNSQFKEIARPTGKLSAQVQLSSAVTLGGYIGYEWEKTRLMPVGAYLSGSDSFGPGAERINAGPVGTFVRTPDTDARDTGQGGLQLRWRADAIDTDLGFYAIRYHATGPSNILNTWAGVPGTPGGARSYRWDYHQGIRAYGMSFAKTLDEWGFAGEASYRENAPLSSAGQAVSPAIGLGVNYDNRNNPGYAVGETAHLQLSWIASLGPNFLARESSFVGEIAWNRRVRTSRNPQMLNRLSDRNAAALRLVYSPAYRQVLPGLDLTPSAGVSFGRGRSSAVGSGFAVDKGGDFNIGLGAVYLATWNVNLSYVQYYGPEGPTLDNANLTQFKQSLRDRNFVSLSLRTTF